jgi:proline racemase
LEDRTQDIPHWHQWTLPAHGLHVNTLDAHVCGQTTRLVLSGIPTPKGKTVLERYANFAKDFDHLRTALLLEPRGHADMQMAVLTPPQKQGSHYGVLFFNRSGMCPLSGHGIIAVATMCLESQLIELKAPETLVRLDTAAGRVRVYASVAGPQVGSVFVENVPSFNLGKGFSVVVPQVGRVVFSAAYGGEFFAYVEAAQVRLSLDQQNVKLISSVGSLVCKAIMEQFEFPHPTEPSLGFLSGVVFYGPPQRKRGKPAPNCRMVCVSPDGSVDRSPSATGLSGWLAQLQADGAPDAEEPYLAEGLLGETLTGRMAKAEVMVGDFKAVVVELEGSAHITGRHCFYMSEADPLQKGFYV